jgi:hypothetical protein
MSNEKTQNTPKIETPKAEAKATAAGGFTPPFMAFDPMQVWTIGQQAWQSTHQAWLASQETFQKLVGEAFGRSQAFGDEIAALETQMTQRAHEAIDQWAKLAHDSINYGVQLSAQARKLGFEAARKMNPGA